MSEKVTQLNTETICTSGQSLTELICSSNGPFDKLCKQLVESNENNLRMEAIFKSMFNQNGHVEKELCELEQTSDCKTSLKLDNCKDKCDCCVQFYTTGKDCDLKMIVCSLIKVNNQIEINLFSFFLGNNAKWIISFL